VSENERGITLSTFRTPATETFVKGSGVNVTVTTWGNHEGMSLMVHGNGAELPLRMAGAFRWEELDVILVALTAARSA